MLGWNGDEMWGRTGGVSVSGVLGGLYERLGGRDLRFLGFARNDGGILDSGFRVCKGTGLAGMPVGGRGF